MQNISCATRFFRKRMDSVYHICWFEYFFLSLQELKTNGSESGKRVV